MDKGALWVKGDEAVSLVPATQVGLMLCLEQTLGAQEVSGTLNLGSSLGSGD